MLDSLKVDAAAPLVENVRKAEQKLPDENNTCKLQFVEEFGQEDYIYTLDKGKKLQAEMDALYTEFADWLTFWEV